MTAFHPCRTLMEFAPDVDEPAIKIVAASIAAKIKFPPLKGRLDAVGFDFNFGEDGLVRHLRLQFTFTDSLVSNAAKSRIGPYLSPLGFSVAFNKTRAPRQKGKPPPWQRTEWVGPHDERVIREVRRKDQLEVLILQRVFIQPASARSTRSLQDLFI